MYHYIKILNVCLSVCLSVCVCIGSGKFGGRDYGSDMQSSYLLHFVLRVRGNKRTQLGSSSWRGHNRE